MKQDVLEIEREKEKLKEKNDQMEEANSRDQKELIELKEENQNQTKVID